MMKNIEPLRLSGLYLFEKPLYIDKRGCFGVGYSKKDLQEIGINSDIVQFNYSNSKKNVLRGLHAQKEPYQQEKIVKVIKGKIMDVVVDFRKESPTYLQHIKVKLSDKKNQSIFIPKGCLHGFLALEDSIVCYQSSEYYKPSHEIGVAWNDPLLAIDWEIKVPITSSKDSHNPFLKNY